MKYNIMFLTVLYFLLFSVKNYSQKKMDYSFQNFFQKGIISQTVISEVSLEYFSYSLSNQTLNAKILYPILDNIEVGGKIGYSYFENNKNGLTNFLLITKYGFEIEKLLFTVGIQIDFRTGSEKVYENYNENSFFAAFYNKLSEKFFINVVINRTFGRIISEAATFRPDLFELNDTANKIGFEFQYSLRDNLNLAFEATSNTYSIIDKHRTILSLGANYDIKSIGALRAALGFDIDDKRGKFLTIGILF